MSVYVCRCEISMYVLSAYVDLEKIGMFELVRGEL